MGWWLDFKERYVEGSVLDLKVVRKAPPGFLFFDFSDNIQGTLHVSELNWNFGLSQTDFRNIKIGSTLRVYVLGFDDRYKKVHLGRKLLTEITPPSKSKAWEDLILQNEIEAIVFEEFRNKVIIQLNTGLFATIPLLEGKSYEVGERIRVIPVRKLTDQNIIECTLREINEITPAQSIEVIETFKEQASDNKFAASEFYLNSFKQISESIYWNYFSKEEQEQFKILFYETGNLFSKVEAGEEAIHLEFDFDFHAYNDFTKNIAHLIFDYKKLPRNPSDTELLLELSKLSFWYTQFELVRKLEGTEQNITETLFSLFNETVSIRGIVSDDGAMKIRNIKAKSRVESLKEKQTTLRKNDVFYINRPIVFSQFASANPFNKDFVKRISNKLIAFKIFEVAMTKSLDILQKQGKDFKIFSNFLESQIDFEVKSANETELQLKDCKLELDIQSDGITFNGLIVGESGLKIDDKVALSNRAKDGRPQAIGSGTVVSISNNKLIVKSNIENYDLIQGGCFVKKISSIKQYAVQLDILNKFFANTLPLDTFYKVFHDKGRIEPPKKVIVEYEDEIFQGKNNPQTQAIDKAIGNQNILLIQGPPGTGKTTVITEIVRQLVKRGEKILVTSQTHVAVDNVLERIMEDTRINIARIGHQDTISESATEYLIEEARKIFSHKVQKTVDIKIELINHHSQGNNISEFSKQSFELPLTFDWNNIEKFISLVQSLNSEQMKLMVETLEEWKEVIAKTPKLLTELFFQNINVLFGTCIGIATNKELATSDVFFDTVLLDEAGKANISETLTAISRAKKIILVGDHKQLPPYLDKDRVEYFKKFSKEVSEQRTSDQEIKQALGASFFEYLQKDGTLGIENKILLSEQHRMHPDIGNFISQSFYDSELQNGEHTKENIIPMSEPFDKQIIFIDTSSDNNSSESFRDGSYFNQVEAEFIINKIIPELVKNKISPKSLAIVSPYKKQCEKISEILAESSVHEYKSAEIATLDSFQGREHDIIIFSFTRSSINKKVGFLDDARRLNVAFSRAKKKLILIGNIETLTSPRSHNDYYYTALFNNLRRYASKYGKIYKINELNYNKLQTNFQVGTILKGTVKRIESYGALINLGNKHGLIPIKELSWIENPIITDVLELNQLVDVKIIRVNEKGILLSMRELVAKPNHTISRKKLATPYNKKANKIELFKNEFKVNDVVEGVVIKIIENEFKTLRVCIEMKFGVEGAFFTFIENRKVKIGSKVKVIISKIDTVKQRVNCKLKA